MEGFNLLFMIYLLILSVLTGITINYNRNWRLFAKSRREVSNTDTEVRKLFGNVISESSPSENAAIQELQQSVRNLQDLVQFISEHTLSSEEKEQLEKLTVEAQTQKEKLINVRDDVKGIGARVKKIEVEVEKIRKQVWQELAPFNE